MNVFEVEGAFLLLVELVLLAVKIFAFVEQLDVLVGVLHRCGQAHQADLV